MEIRMTNGKSNNFNEVQGLEELILSFSEKAKNEKPTWIAKYTAIEFEYNGKEYRIVAEDLKVTDEQFECIQKEMTESIKKLGAVNVWCYGFLD